MKEVLECLFFILACSPLFWFAYYMLNDFGAVDGPTYKILKK
jgi:hypothetical protein